MQRRTFSIVFWTISSISVLVSFSARATPYASSVSVYGSDVSFVLNEPADNVTVVFDGGASSQDLGALNAGAHTFSLGAASTFRIVVKKDSGAGYTQGAIKQISLDANPLVRFNSPRGVAVNKNPSSTAFGRVYVANSAAGTTAGRTLGDGIYVLNPDLSEVPGLGTNVLTAGLNWTNGTGGNTESPHRLTLARDDKLYIGDWSDPNGSLFVADINVANGQNVLGGLIGGPYPVTTSRIHGSISAAWVEGSLATGDLTAYVIDEDLQTDRTVGGGAGSGTERNSVWRWEIGAGPLPFETPPTKFMSPLIVTDSQLADLTRGPDGKWYVSQRRAEPATVAGVFVRASDGSALWNSRQASRDFLGNQSANDLLGETAAIDVSPDGKWLAVLRRDNNAISLLPLTDGIPNMTNRLVLATSPTTVAARDIGFDAAGNLYYVSSGQGLMRVFSPGGKTTATTGSDGTFSVQVEELARISASSPDNSAAEQGLDSATITLTRTGDVSQPLTVDYQLAGLAVNGEDYTTLPLSATFEAGQATVDIVFTPIDDNVAELLETARLNLVFSTNYAVQIPTNATIYIADNDPTALRLSVVETNMYEPLPRDTATFTITRLGQTNTDIFAVILETFGTATETADFQLSQNGFSFPPNLVTTNITLSPVNDFEREGPEFVTVRLVDSSEYGSDPANTVSFRIIDDEQPPAPVLFSDDFSSDTSTNWQMRFGANNGIFDATVEWAFDYSTLGIGPAPNTTDTSTLGLRIAVNKNEGTAGGSAGINFYPIGQKFKGDYALRFDMYLSYGTPATTTTEHAIAGLNHSGDRTVRATQSTDTNNTTAGGDGVWINIVADASDLRDYAAYTYSTPGSLPQILTNRPASAFTSIITRPPYSVAGSPSSSGASQSWADVELSQVNRNITLKVNNNVIFRLTNSTPYTSGNIMLGMNDQFDSIGGANNFVVLDNVRVVSLAFDITSVQLVSGNQIQIDFTSPNGEAPSAFALQSRDALGAGSWETDSGAVITSTGPGQFRVVASRTGAERYYQIVK